MGFRPAVWFEIGSGARPLAILAQAGIQPYRGAFPTRCELDSLLRGNACILRFHSRFPLRQFESDL
jgi:hypothetical protein